MSPSNSNETCVRERAEDGPPLFQNGNVVFQAYHVGWIITGFFALLATAVSIWLINKHLQWYTSKREQRYIVRILFMVPIYALVSFASFLFWNHSTILILIRDGYESTVLTSFFYLLLLYLSHDIEEQKAIFRRVGLSREADREAAKKGNQLKKWIFPIGFVKWKPQDGLFFLQLMKWGVLQYCVIRPTTTLAAVILDYNGLYCEESWGLGWGHIYITIIVSLSVTIAMYCLIQLYVPVASNLSSQRPLLKLFAIKAVVFLTFWQATFLSVLSMFGVVKGTKYMTAADINIGIGAILETVEMTIFAFLHIRAFTYRPYQPVRSPGLSESEPERTPRLKSLGHAMDFRETFRELWIGCSYLWDKIRGREPTPDAGARRIAYYEEAFGRHRFSRFQEVNINPREGPKKGPEATLPKIEVGIEEHIDIDIEGERQWLGLGPIRREHSESLTVQVERELEKRGYSNDTTAGRRVITPPTAKPNQDAGRQPSWWRRIYNRLSEHGSEHEDEQGQTLLAHRSKRWSRRRAKGAKDVDREFPGSLDDIDNLTPAETTRRHFGHSRNFRRSAQEDVLAPLPIFSDPRVPRPRAAERMDISGHSVTSVNNLSISVETNASKALSIETKYDDGQAFPGSTRVEGIDVVKAGGSSEPRSSGFLQESPINLSNARNQLFVQHDEFLALVETIPQHEHRSVLDSTAQVYSPAIRSLSESHHSLHHRESAHDHGRVPLLYLLPNGSQDADTGPLGSSFQMSRY